MVEIIFSLERRGAENCERRDITRPQSQSGLVLGWS